MATVTKPIALDESLNTTEATPRNIADVLAEGIGDLIHAVSQIAPQTVYDLDDLGDVDITSPSNGQVLKYNGTSQKWENGAGGAGGGHTIEDRDGVELPQRANLKFVDGLKATDDGANDTTEVSNAPDVYTWNQWNQLTTAQQEAIPHALITDAPDVDAGVNADLLTKLWENPTPTVEFAAQDIILSSGDYDFLLVIYTYATSIQRSMSVIARKRENIFLTCAVSSSTGAASIDRGLLYSTDTKLQAGDGRSSIGTSAMTTNNTGCIPLVIYGIKKTINLQFTAIASDVSTSANKCMLSDGETSVQDAIDNLGVWSSQVVNDTYGTITFYKNITGMKIASFSLTTLPSSSTSIASSIPAEYRPTSLIFSTSTCNNNGISRSSLLRTTGAIDCDTSSTSGLQGQVVYY